MIGLPRWLTLGVGLLVIALTSVATQAAEPDAAPVLKIDGLGKGAVPLDGSWQFHLGDNMVWASPGYDDSGWEQLTADRPFGMQGHRGYQGFAWYRRHIQIEDGPDGPSVISLLVPGMEDACEVYWNGRLVGELGKVPPHPLWFEGLRPKSFVLGRPGQGVLAVRVWKAPFDSFDSGLQGGFYAPPQLGGPRSIAAALENLNYEWLRSQQLTFALDSLYALVGLVSFIAWLRDRRQWLAFWMASFAICHVVSLVAFSARLPLSSEWALAISTPFYSMVDVSLWFFLMWLLDLRGDFKLMRLVRITAAIDLAFAILDALTAVGFSSPHPVPWQWADAVFTVPTTLALLLSFYIIGVAMARRLRLDRTRWMVALFAVLTEMLSVCVYTLEQGSRFTHWTLGYSISAPLFSVLGSPVNASDMSGVLLLVAMAIAVFRYSQENSRRQSALAQELRNARAVQQVLVPAEVPAIVGFAIQSVYRPAGEVGGDFFQILPVETGGALAVIGDVSGKGIPAAMTVSLLVGTVRTLAHYTQNPGEILAAMNQRMMGRGQGGFTTCLVVRADADGTLTVANAGHLAPYLDGAELEVENGLPLGLSARSAYNESRFRIEPGQQLTLLTDGVVEARNAAGELFSFERTRGISGHPAQQIVEVAQHFGQQDDITVLTLRRLGVTEEARMGTTAASEALA